MLKKFMKKYWEDFEISCALCLKASFWEKELQSFENAALVNEQAEFLNPQLLY